MPEWSASYDGYNVQKGVIHANHIEMVKFASKPETGYCRVLDWIQQMAGPATRTPSQNTTEDDEEEEEEEFTPLLFIAAASPEPVVLERVLRDTSPEAINKRYRDNTALAMAISRDLPKNVQLLVEAGADLKALTVIQGAKMTPLMFASALDRPEVIETLITKGKVDPNEAAIEKGYTALHAAIMNNKVNAIRKLLEHGADPWKRGPEGYTPIDAAIGTERGDLVQILTEGAKQALEKSTPPHPIFELPDSYIQSNRDLDMFTSPIEDASNVLGKYNKTDPRYANDWQSNVDRKDPPIPNSNRWGAASPTPTTDPTSGNPGNLQKTQEGDNSSVQIQEFAKDRFSIKDHARPVQNPAAVGIPQK